MPLNDALGASITDAKIANPGGYVYAIFSARFRALYIGQTVGYQGALGRLAQHLSDGVGNTFRQRICSIYKYDDVDIGPIDFAAVRLRPNNVFHGRAADFREAIEALVQYQLIESISAAGLRLGVISRVTLNSYSRLGYVADEADQVTSYLFVWLKEHSMAKSDSTECTNWRTAGRGNLGQRGEPAGSS